MKEIALLIHEDINLSTISGVLDMVRHTNRFLVESGKTEAFSVMLVGEKINNNLLYFPAQFTGFKTIDEIKDVDLVIAPAFYGPPDLVMRKNKNLIDFIRNMYNKGAEVASLCFGSYFLAEAGVLNGKPCTTHWVAVDDMKRRYPDVNILPDMVTTDKDGTYTSGGAFSSMNLILYLIEKYCGRDTGIWASKMFSLDIDRTSQAHFKVFEGQHQHEDQEIMRSQLFIENNYHLPISVEEIAGQTNMSKRNFIRRFKSATQNTPMEYLQKVKIESVKKGLEKTNFNISELMYKVGYNDLKTFRKIFKRITGLTPQDYRSKYCRRAVLEN
ncbi:MULTISPECIES: GlxA family transcriptional regulator [Mucilaginibacter]|uniref:GlxA family transcriptional regulator n=1 Tax=Mucilaginibacter TaxID=423349 RepID=UPI001668ABE2|nr:helix-turn-helix domain-containing protein [Mucilaginibacter rubeus]GGB19145.1 AraC family transcriptional regulator [Mucilaginibacter rubeus]